MRTQQLLAYEHGAGDVIDPLGGSFTIEKMTADLEEEAGVLIDEIDKLGGMVAAIEAGYVQRQIEKAAYDHQLAIESGERPVVGINCVEAIFEAVRQEATLGEVADRLREAFGEYRDPSCTT